MNYEDLVNYFELYVTDYKPYKDDKLYQAIIKFLYEYYLKHSYEEFPKLFKKAFENQTFADDLLTNFEDPDLPKTFYEMILLSNGFPQTLLDTLSNDDKRILVNSLMDYAQYKGTLSYFRVVANAFDDNFNMYELFIDYKTYIDPTTKESLTGWVFVPYNIHTSINSKDEPISDFFTFEDISEEAKHFFVTKDQLEEMRLNGDILLPIKSNLLLINQVNIKQTSPLINLYFSMIFSYFKDELLFTNAADLSIPLAFRGMTIEHLYTAWFYIMLKIKNDPITFFVPPFCNLFDADNKFFSGITIPNSINQIQEEYNSIINNHGDEHFRRKLDAFYKKYIDVFGQTVNPNLTKIEIENWSAELKTKPGMTPFIISYIDEILDPVNISADSDIQKEAIKLLDYLFYTGLLGWLRDPVNPVAALANTKLDPTIWPSQLDLPDSKKKVYFNFFTDLFPFIVVKLTDTATYKILSFLKPFHVDLIGKTKDILRIKDNFNGVYADSDAYFEIEILKASLAEISHSLINTINFAPHYDTQHALVEYMLELDLYQEACIEIIEKYKTFLEMQGYTLGNLSHECKTELDFLHYDVTHILLSSKLINTLKKEIEVLINYYEKYKTIHLDGTRLDNTHKSLKRDMKMKNHNSNSMRIMYNFEIISNLSHDWTEIIEV
ncbi:MAG: hypothetical protein H7836_04790 [Magnetococcus sp. YQC-3]